MTTVTNVATPHAPLTGNRKGGATKGATVRRAAVWRMAEGGPPSDGAGAGGMGDEASGGSSDEQMEGIICDDRLSSVVKTQLLGGEHVKLAMRLLLSARFLPEVMSCGPRRGGGDEEASRGRRLRAVPAAHVRPLLFGDVRVSASLNETERSAAASGSFDWCRGPYDKANEQPSGLFIRTARGSHGPRVAIGFEESSPTAAPTCDARASTPATLAPAADAQDSASEAGAGADAEVCRIVCPPPRPPRATLFVGREWSIFWQMHLSSCGPSSGSRLPRPRVVAMGYPSPARPTADAGGGGGDDDDGEGVDETVEEEDWNKGHVAPVCHALLVEEVGVGSNIRAMRFGVQSAGADGKTTRCLLTSFDLHSLPHGWHSMVAVGCGGVCMHAISKWRDPLSKPVPLSPLTRRSAHPIWQVARGSTWTGGTAARSMLK